MTCLPLYLSVHKDTSLAITMDTKPTEYLVILPPFENSSQMYCTEISTLSILFIHFKIHKTFLCRDISGLWNTQGIRLSHFCQNTSNKLYVWQRFKIRLTAEQVWEAIGAQHCATQIEDLQTEYQAQVSPLLKKPAFDYEVEGNRANAAVEFQNFLAWHVHKTQFYQENCC